ncbi:MAG: hypothetical protein NW214_02500 [Pseudanabaenaceae cyanobacterium bins.39]|nr:hypothetical protein [Pseudanabaenaceae cyanobacterium bins.39]
MKKSISWYVGGFILLILIFLGGTIWHNLNWLARNPINRIDIPTQAGIQAKAEISDFEQVTGTEILRASLYISNEDQGLSGYKGYQPIQNYIFFNTANQAFYLLKPTDQSLLLSTLTLRESPDTDASGNNAEMSKVVAPTGFVYLVADQDTNNDQRIDYADLKKIAISDLSGLRFKILLDRVTQLKGASSLQNNRVFIFYLADQQLKAAEVDWRSQSVINTSVLKQN